MVLAITSLPGVVSAEKKATEAQNEADVEFYEPTPTKPETKKPEEKKLDPVTRLLPKTGEKEDLLGEIFGTSLLALGTVIFFTRKRVGDTNEN